MMTTVTQKTSQAAVLESIEQFEAHYGYDAECMREIVKLSEEGANAYQALLTLSYFKSDAPPDLAFSVKITAVISEDCGPCVQLSAKMAQEAGLTPANIKAILSGDIEQMSPNAILGYRFAQAVLAHSAEADTYRDEIVSRWGKQALVALSFSIVAARAFPTVKYSMGYGQSCTRVMVDGQPVTVKH